MHRTSLSSTPISAPWIRSPTGCGPCRQQWPDLGPWQHGGDRRPCRKSTRLIDAGWRLVLPGFQDTHIHLQDGGYDLQPQCHLDTCITIAELQQTLARLCADQQRPLGERSGWYTGIFTDHNLNRYVLDAAVPDRPCYIVASDGHNACLNSKACALVGLVRGTPDPENGHFVLDANGEPTGMLHERPPTGPRASCRCPATRTTPTACVFAKPVQPPWHNGRDRCLGERAPRPRLWQP